MYIGKIDGQTSSLNVNAINRSAAIKKEALYGKKKEDENTDVVTVSPAGKNQSLIEQLMKQKEFLQERKQSLIDSAAENGSAGIDVQLKDYEKQLAELDEQITQLQTEQTADKKTDDDDSTGRIYEKPKTEEESKMDQLNDITELSAGTEQAEIISSAQDQLDGRVHVLSSEVKYGSGNIEAKLEKIADIESQSRKLSSQIAEKLGETNASISESIDSTEENFATANKNTIEDAIPLEPEAETLSGELAEKEGADTDTISQQDEITNTNLSK